MKISKHIRRNRAKSSEIPEDLGWKEFLNALSFSGLFAIMETDNSSISYANVLAKDLLHYDTSSPAISSVLLNSDKLKRLKEDQTLTLRTVHSNKPVRLRLLKKLSGRKRLFIIVEEPDPASLISAEKKPDSFQRTEALMSLLLQSCPMTYYSYDPLNRNAIWYSEQIEKLSGFSLSDFRANPGLWVSRIHPEDYQQLSGFFDEISPNAHVSCEYRWLRANDQVIWIYDQAIKVMNPVNLNWEVVGCFMDITDRKEAEFALFESERNYREIFNSSNEAIFIHDPVTGKVEDVNDTMLKMYKTTYKNALTKDLMHFSDRRPPYDAEHARQHIEKAVHSKEGHTFTWLAHRDDQSAFWAEVTLKSITISGITKVMAGVKNIDENRKADEQIKYQKDFEKLILDISTKFINVPFGEADKEIEASIKKICHFTNTDAGQIFLHDDVNHTINLHYAWHKRTASYPGKLQINDEEIPWYLEKMRNGESIILETLDDIPEDQADLRILVTDHGVKSLANVPLFYQNRFIGSFGIAVNKPERRWLPYEVSLLKLTGQIFVNVIKRKESVEKLLESEEKYRHLIENQSEFIITLDSQANLLYVSPSYCELFNITKDELPGRNFMEFIHTEDQKETVRLLNGIQKPPYTTHVEHRANTNKGWRWIAWNYKAILNDSNQVIEITGVGRDITYQKGVEDALRRSEDRFRSIVQHLSDIIFIIDKETHIIYDTPTVKQVLGYDEGFLVGAKGFDYVHPDDLDKIINQLHNILNNIREGMSIELRFKHSDGRWIPLEGTGINMLDHPSIQGIVVTLRDITERKQVEKKILDAVLRTEEQERERFAKNLHDDLGPLLSSIKMYINSLNTANKEEKQEFIIAQLNEVVREAIQTTKEVSNDLSPHILQNYGLVSAIDNFMHKVPTTISIEFTNSLPSERYSNTVENSLYRIIKELVNNTLKHAEANEIRLQIEEKGNSLYLYYSDNGKGFEMESNKIMASSGMGLSNIISRAKTLNANFEFHTGLNKGFEFKMTIPLYQSLE